MGGGGSHPSSQTKYVAAKTVCVFIIVNLKQLQTNIMTFKQSILNQDIMLTITQPAQDFIYIHIPQKNINSHKNIYYIFHKKISTHIFPNFNENFTQYSIQHWHPAQYMQMKQCASDIFLQITSSSPAQLLWYMTLC